MKTAIDKLTWLRAIDAHQMDVSALPNERHRFLAQVARRSTNQGLERRKERKFPILLAFVAQAVGDQLDEVVSLFDQAVGARESRAKSKTDEALVERARSTRTSPVASRTWTSANWAPKQYISYWARYGLPGISAVTSTPSAGIEPPSRSRSLPAAAWTVVPQQLMPVEPARRSPTPPSSVCTMRRATRCRGPSWSGGRAASWTRTM
ncbi:hypothetical protein ACFPOI_33625 [Nonomuraea angiospora]|uniref:Transposase n=1 Tax=Nonomuraea angiospora TaxID=46172 RepID=A0ABR9LU07_9ACTN|nr:hypothetical protein [Nonomuraea angiospora]MBE1583780.1 hypothetical protein [Nonomuraea angiospora]